MYVDQFSPRDLARDLAKKYNVPIFDSIDKALTGGGNSINVDGVRCVAEAALARGTSAVGPRRSIEVARGPGGAASERGDRVRDRARPPRHCAHRRQFR